MFLLGTSSFPTMIQEVSRIYTEFTPIHITSMLAHTPDTNPTTTEYPVYHYNDIGKPEPTRTNNNPIMMQDIHSALQEKPS
jgi:hypothetical protein